MPGPSTIPNSPPTHRILVLDDEEIVVLALRETLSRVGYHVLGTGDPSSAIQLLHDHPFAVIITDQQMPRMTGLEFLAHAKQIQPDATRILITAVLNLNTVIDAINKGEIYRFIIKPWIREEFLGAVQNAVQRFQLVSQNAQLQAATLAMNERLSSLNLQLEAQLLRVDHQNRQLESLNNALHANLQHSVELCLKTMETFYPTLGSQARRVAQLSNSMASELNLPLDQQQSLQIAALLHDIGLVGVPRRLIRRWELDPLSLNDAERDLIQQHPILGEELASFVHHLQSVRSAIRSHHERFDGLGYPDRLAGNQIPWHARLLAVASAYAESHADPASATQLIRDLSGSAFDPDAVLILLRCLPRSSIPKRQREVSLAELKPGMVLAKGIYTANGILLVPDGQQLSETYIDKLRNHHRINPISQSLIVYG